MLREMRALWDDGISGRLLLVGIAVIVAGTLYFLYDRLTGSVTSSNGHVIEKRLNSGHFHLVHAGTDSAGNSINVPVNEPDTYLVLVRVGDDRMWAYASKEFFDTLEPGSPCKVLSFMGGASGNVWRTEVHPR